MAKKVENPKGFLVIEVSGTENIEKIGGMAICDSCNSHSSDGYYIAVLNHWVCPDCFNEWIERAKRHEEDIRIEQRNYDFYSQLLGL